MTETITLKYYETDSGYCRVYYKGSRESGKEFLYCVQDEGPGKSFMPIIYRCSLDGEPDYPCSMKAGVVFEASPELSELNKNVNHFLKENNLLAS